MLQNWTYFTRNEKITKSQRSFRTMYKTRGSTEDVSSKRDAHQCRVTGKTETHDDVSHAHPHNIPKKLAVIPCLYTNTDTHVVYLAGSCPGCSKKPVDMSITQVLCLALGSKSICLALVRPSSHTRIVQKHVVG